MPHRFNGLPPISLGPLPCGCSPGGVLCVSVAVARRHPSLTVWTTRVSNTDRTPYFRGSAPMPPGWLPWPLGAHTPSTNFTSWACRPPTSRACWQGGVERPWPPRAVPSAPPQRGRALRPVTTDNAFPAMSYRNCWHIFSPGLSGWRCNLPPPRLTPRHDVGRTSACSNVRPVTKIPHCCLWRGFLRPQVAGQPLSPAWDRRPTFAPNPPRAHPAAATWPTRRSYLPSRTGSRVTHPLAAPFRRPNSHVSGVVRAFVPNHSQIQPTPLDSLTIERSLLSHGGVSGRALERTGLGLRPTPARPLLVLQGRSRVPRGELPALTAPSG